MMYMTGSSGYSRPAVLPGPAPAALDGDSRASSADTNRTRAGARKPLAASWGPYRMEPRWARHSPAREMGTAASYWSYGLTAL